VVHALRVDFEVVHALRVDFEAVWMMNLWTV
ncbi:hypothetical protein Tco_0475170, partial [Tanacetum coccineum]